MIKGESESYTHTALVFAFFSVLNISNEFSKFQFQFLHLIVIPHSTLVQIFSSLYERCLAKVIDDLILRNQIAFQQLSTLLP